jgi:uncharacterized membrane protein YqiK
MKKKTVIIIVLVLVALWILRRRMSGFNGGGAMTIPGQILGFNLKEGGEAGSEQDNSNFPYNSTNRFKRSSSSGV